MDARYTAGIPCKNVPESGSATNSRSNRSNTDPNDDAAATTTAARLGVALQYLRAVLERLGQKSVPREDGDVFPELDVARRLPPARIVSYIHTCQSSAVVGRRRS